MRFRYPSSVGASAVILVALAILVAGCRAGPSAPPTAEPPPSPTPTPTPSPTPTDEPTATGTPTPLPLTATPTATPVPQRVLLRRACGRDYAVRSGEPLEILYGGWGTIGLNLAQEWSTALVVDISIDGAPVQGQAQPPVNSLPANCREDDPALYWIYSSLALPGVDPGRHDVVVSFNALRPLDDGSGTIYGPGQIAQQTFRILGQ